MLAAIIIYIILLFVIGLAECFKIKDFKDYAVAGKKQTFFRVFLALMATMIGASATMGMAEQTLKIGFSAFWWLGVGAIGLLLQAIFLSEKIRSFDANTLPELATKTVGEGAGKLLALIIAVSWVGIIGAQFVSLQKIISVMLPSYNKNLILVIIAAVVIMYTIIGGQLSVIKIDSIQSYVIAGGIIATFIYLYVIKNSNAENLISHIALFNDEFGINEFINLLFITGGAYFLGPDIISRNLVAKDGKTAKKAAVASAFALVLFGVIITLIGMWAVENITPEAMNGQNPLIYIMDKYLPYPIAVILCIGLVSALVSSADTCLVNAASIVENDLLKRDKVWEVRIIVCFLGMAGLLIALFNSNIIDLLMGAYSIYVPGIVCPLLVGILCYGKKKIILPMWYLAVFMGGLMGLLSTYFGIGGWLLPLIGMGVSLVLSLASIREM